MDHTFWYLSRAAGLSAYVVLVVNMALGLALSLSLPERWVKKWRLFDLHQVSGLMVVGLLALHVFALLGDAYIGYTLPELLVPFLSPYRPWPVALGILGFYLTLVVTFTFYVRQWIGRRTWRLIHYGSFAVFALGLLHGILSGTDTGTPWAVAIYAASALGIGGLTWWRLRTAGPLPSGRSGRAQPRARFAGS
jgi:methionine sulfoxide reductase heme-binding subunit